MGRLQLLTPKQSKSFVCNLTIKTCRNCAGRCMFLIFLPVPKEKTLALCSGERCCTLLVFIQRNICVLKQESSCMHCNLPKNQSRACPGQRWVWTASTSQVPQTIHTYLHKTQIFTYFEINQNARHDLVFFFLVCSSWSLCSRPPTALCLTPQSKPFHQPGSLKASIGVDGDSLGSQLWGFPNPLLCDVVALTVHLYLLYPSSSQWHMWDFMQFSCLFSDMLQWRRYIFSFSLFSQGFKCKLS